METPPFQIWITTYEMSERGLNPVLSHVFYGKSLEEAFNYAKSHLITDYFFSSSFIGEMLWRDSILKLTNKGMITHMYYPQNNNEIQQIMTELGSLAKGINADQINSGIVMLIQQIASK